MAPADQKERNIVIIGGGIIGCSTAYYLTRHPLYDPSKHSITILEASQIAGGASGKAGGLLALWAFPKCLVPLSFRLHAELAKEHDGEERWGYREVNCGELVAHGRPAPDSPAGRNPGRRASASVSLGKRRGGSISGGDAGSSSSAAATAAAAASAARGGVLEALQAAGIPTDLDWFDATTLKRYEEMAAKGSTAQVHPFWFTTSMAILAQERGAKVILGSVTDISYPDDKVKSVTYKDNATGTTKTIDATDIIVSAGPWTRRIYPPAPISALRAHSVVIRPSRPISAYALFTQIKLPADTSTSGQASLVSPEIYARPDNSVYICGEGDTLVPLPDTTTKVEVDQSRCQGIIDAVASVSDDLRDGEVLIRQACYLPSVFPDGGPLLGKTGVGGLYLAAGHTCWGIQNAPATGKLMSEFVFEGRAKSAQIAELDPRKVM
ncbi:hypothetical protein FQN57_002345 [Myotisia sp. PD_48]|nr:hypothetical protein FQN57_002345 [Myotisia sp. PD_48]